MTRKSAAVLFGLVLLLRVVIAGEFRGNFDSQSYLIAASATILGHNVYTVTDRYNYSPVWAFVVAGLFRAAGGDAPAFVLLVGLLLIAVDLVTARLVYLLAARRLGRSADDARRAALLFFANPVSVIVSCGHGQFDGLAVLGVLVGVYAATGEEVRGRAASVVAALSASILFKHVTAFHPLLFWRGLRGRRGFSLALLAIPYAVFALSFWPYRDAGRRILDHVVFYGARTSSTVQHTAGWLDLVSFGRDPLHLSLVLFLGTVAAVVWWTRDLELPRAAFLLFLSNLTFLPSAAPQYFVWPIALGSLYASPGLAAFSTAAAVCHSAFPGSLSIDWGVKVTMLGVWFAGFLWLADELRRAAASKRASQAMPE
jgi:hypothetical protein